MIKVCHVTSAHNRYDVRIFEKQCVSLAQNGFNISLLVNDDLQDEIKKGVKIISSKFRPRNRIDRFINSRNKLYKKAIELDADIYHLHDPDLLLLGSKLLKLNKKVIFDSHEDVPETIMEKHWIPSVYRRLIKFIYCKYEKVSLKQYTALVSVTPHIVERLTKINPKTIMITNYPIVNENEVINKNTENYICFTGGISEQWNHEIVLDAITHIDNIRYIIAGSGSETYINKLKSHPAWNKVDYLGLLPFSEVKKIFTRSLAGIALNWSLQAGNIGTLGNTKLFEYMEAKLPVICTNYKLWREIINKNNCGIVVNPNNSNEVKEAINYIIKNTKESEDMGNNGRDAVLNEFNWKTQEKILIKMYLEILSEK
ncbi:glycosyltransferase [Mobilitalea sibirica]|uniref:Glycosyltransferase n=1 Tax=Mobilitalea sibirica TaxID=1462919 RepID=A0A8J7H4T4_9FIRM|nr:glycosyltransferase [Mobilitalea sibirica]MBH1942047.1 glycosyltransferase [Mobilitalea sibirica]